MKLSTLTAIKIASSENDKANEIIGYTESDKNKGYMVFQKLTSAQRFEIMQEVGDNFKGIQQKANACYDLIGENL